MATIIKKIIFGLLFVITTNISLAHTIYAPNDIPLLDNRFRIDPHTEQVTFVLNHSQGPQVVVLVRPDGSKLNYQDHPESVSWVTTNKLDIITIPKPMTGPWQAVAELDGDNRIKLISNVELKTSKLPLKLFEREYITTHASLYYDNEIMTDKNYLSGARLSVSLIGTNKKKLALYKDNGENYDALPFDGDLTARMFVNLNPGRYLLSIRTKNNIFMRSQNKDAVVFPFPISYKINTLEYGSKEALFTFRVDSDELDPKSVIIDGTVKDANNKVIGKLIAHSAENISETNIFTQAKEFGYGAFTLSGKVFATTTSGREIELQLPEQEFNLMAKVIIPPVVSEAIATDVAEEGEPTSIWENTWVIIAIVVIGLLMILGIVFIILRRRKKSKQLESGEELSLDELSAAELQPESIDLNPTKK